MIGACLEIRNLSVTYRAAGDFLRVLSGVNLTLGREIVGIRGHSGSGKTTLARAILRLFPPRQAEIEGQILLDNENLVGMPLNRLRTIRGSRLSFIPQESSIALSPVRTIESQIADVIRAHRTCSRVEACEISYHWLLRVFGWEADRIRFSYPHQLSGGQRQRVLFLQAVCCAPSLIVADEPTSNLDSVARKAILQLLRSIHEENGTTIILMSHDHDALTFTCNRVVELQNGCVHEAV